MFFSYKRLFLILLAGFGIFGTAHPKHLVWFSLITAPKASEGAAAASGAASGAGEGDTALPRQTIAVYPSLISGNKMFSEGFRSKVSDKRFTARDGVLPIGNEKTSARVFLSKLYEGNNKQITVIEHTGTLFVFPKKRLEYAPGLSAIWYENDAEREKYMKLAVALEVAGEGAVEDFDDATYHVKDFSKLNREAFFIFADILAGIYSLIDRIEGNIFSKARVAATSSPQEEIAKIAREIHIPAGMKDNLRECAVNAHVPDIYIKALLDNCVERDDHTYVIPEVVDGAGDGIDRTPQKVTRKTEAGAAEPRLGAKGSSLLKRAVYVSVRRIAPVAVGDDLKELLAPTEALEKPTYATFAELAADETWKPQINFEDFCRKRGGVEYKTVSLDLSGFGLENLDGILDAYRPEDLSQVEYLNLGSNNFAELKKEWIAPFESLTHIIISHNKITSLPEDIMPDMVSYFIADDAGLTAFSFNIFQDPDAVEQVLLINNKELELVVGLDSLTEDAALNTLNIKKCNITALDIEALIGAPKLKTLIVSSNPIAEDCLSRLVPYATKHLSNLGVQDVLNLTEPMKVFLESATKVSAAAAEVERKRVEGLRVDADEGSFVGSSDGRGADVMAAHRKVHEVFRADY